jgi:K+-transporting ATPase KdpF subunit
VRDARPRSAEDKYGPPGPTPLGAMGTLQSLADNLGLVTLGVLSLALTIYLVYSMVHPERF